MTKTKEKIAIHCPTEELWERVLNKLESNGWGRYDFINYSWSIFTSRTCLDLHKYHIYKVSTPNFKSQCECNGLTIIPAEEWLLCGDDKGCRHRWDELCSECKRELKVGDPVEVLDGEGDRAWSCAIGSKGKISKVYKDGSYLVDIYPRILSERIDPQDLKLIESEDSMKEEKRGLKAGNRVKFIGDVDGEGGDADGYKEGHVYIIDSLDIGYEEKYCYLRELNGNIVGNLTQLDFLELAPESPTYTVPLRVRDKG